MNIVPLNTERKTPFEVVRLRFTCSRGGERKAGAAGFVRVILNSVVSLHQTCSASSEAFVRPAVVSLRLNPLKRHTGMGLTQAVITPPGTKLSLLVGSDMSQLATIWQKLTFLEIFPCFWFFFHLRRFLHLPLIPQKGLPARLLLVLPRDVDFLHCDQTRQRVRKGRAGPSAESRTNKGASARLLPRFCSFPSCWFPPLVSSERRRLVWWRQKSNAAPR